MSDTHPRMSREHVMRRKMTADLQHPEKSPGHLREFHEAHDRLKASEFLKEVGDAAARLSAIQAELENLSRQWDQIKGSGVKDENHEAITTYREAVKKLQAELEGLENELLTSQEVWNKIKSEVNDLKAGDKLKAGLESFKKEAQELEALMVQADANIAIRPMVFKLLKRLQSSINPASPNTATVENKASTVTPLVPDQIKVDVKRIQEQAAEEKRKQELTELRKNFQKTISEMPGLVNEDIDTFLGDRNYTKYDADAKDSIEQKKAEILDLKTEIENLLDSNIQIEVSFIRDLQTTLEEKIKEFTEELSTFILSADLENKNQTVTEDNESHVTEDHEPDIDVEDTVAVAQTAPATPKKKSLWSRTRELGSRVREAFRHKEVREKIPKIALDTVTRVFGVKFLIDVVGYGFKKGDLYAYDKDSKVLEVELAIMNTLIIDTARDIIELKANNQLAADERDQKIMGKYEEIDKEIRNTDRIPGPEKQILLSKLKTIIDSYDAAKKNAAKEHKEKIKSTLREHARNKINGVGLVRDGLNTVLLAAGLPGIRSVVFAGLSAYERFAQTKRERQDSLGGNTRTAVLAAQEFGRALIFKGRKENASPVQRGLDGVAAVGQALAVLGIGARAFSSDAPSVFGAGQFKELIASLKDRGAAGTAGHNIWTNAARVYNTPANLRKAAGHLLHTDKSPVFQDAGGKTVPGVRSAIAVEPVIKVSSPDKTNSNKLSTNITLDRLLNGLSTLGTVNQDNSIHIKVGGRTVESALTRVALAAMSDRVGGELDSAEAAQATNVAANLKQLLGAGRGSAHDVVMRHHGEVHTIVKAEDTRGVIEYDKKSHTIKILDQENFKNKILNPLVERATKGSGGKSAIGNHSGAAEAARHINWSKAAHDIDEQELKVAKFGATNSSGGRVGGSALAMGSAQLSGDASGRIADPYYNLAHDIGSESAPADLSTPPNYEDVTTLGTRDRLRAPGGLFNPFPEEAKLSEVTRLSDGSYARNEQAGAIQEDLDALAAGAARSKQAGEMLRALNLPSAEVSQRINLLDARFSRRFDNINVSRISRAVLGDGQKSLQDAVRKIQQEMDNVMAGRATSLSKEQVELVRDYVRRPNDFKIVERLFASVKGISGRANELGFASLFEGPQLNENRPFFAVPGSSVARVYMETTVGSGQGTRQEIALNVGPRFHFETTGTELRIVDAKGIPLNTPQTNLCIFEANDREKLLKAVDFIRKLSF